MPKWIAVGWLLLSPSLSDAQSDWSRVQALPSNARLRIEVNNTVLEGRFHSADDTRVTLTGGSIARADVRQVEHLRNRKADGFAKGILAGFAIGAGLSLANTGNGSNAVIAGLTLGGLGGLAGLTWGINNPKW